MSEEQVILVDENDNEIGTSEKLAAHQNGGQLHRAFSILIFNSQDELLLQKRESNKYHCGGMWTNTCCSHPRPGEKLLDAVSRRLKEEMGMKIDNLREEFSFIYKKEFLNGLTEHELDHVIFGTSDEDPVLNPEEAEDFKWISLEDLKKDMDTNPDIYTFWFKKIIEKIG